MAKAGNPRSKLARANIFPCGYCEKNVSWSKTAIACDVCDVWFHRSCHSLSVSKFEHLAENTWRCYRCQTFLNNSFTYHSYELLSDDNLSHYNSKNPSEDKSTSRSNCSNTNYSPRRAFCPPSHSTPESQHHRPTSSNNNNNSHSSSNANISVNHSIIQTSTNLSILSSHGDISSLLKSKGTNNWRTIVLNANGLNMTEKRANLEHLLEYIQPDAIIISETNLTPGTSSSEILPLGYLENKPLRRDVKGEGRGVLVAVKDSYTLTQFLFQIILQKLYGEKLSFKIPNH